MEPNTQTPQQPDPDTPQHSTPPTVDPPVIDKTHHVVMPPSLVSAVEPTSKRIIPVVESSPSSDVPNVTAAPSSSPVKVPVVTVEETSDVPAAATERVPNDPVVASVDTPDTAVVTPDDASGVPAAGRFDLSTVYPTVPEKPAPSQAQEVTVPTTNESSIPAGTAQPTPPVPTVQPTISPAPTAATGTQDSNVFRTTGPTDVVTVPMKNIFVVGLVGPFATIGTYAALYMLTWFLVINMFSDGIFNSAGSSFMSIITNPGVQAAILAGFLYANIRITATYFNDLKIPKPSMTALFSVLLVFSTVAIGIKNAETGSYASIVSGFGSSYLFIILALFSGLLWYPLSVKWGLSPVESTFKKIYPFIAGGIIVIGVGLYLVALFKSSANLL